MLITGALREHGPEDVDIGHDPAAALVQPGGQALIEIAGGRVIGAAERPWIGVEGVTEPPGDEAANVDDVHARARSDLEIELDRR
jgi:hypothetical protein